MFMLKTVIEHYVKHRSTVTISALDISKAFDTVDHYAFLNSVNGQGISLLCYKTGLFMLLFAGEARYHIGIWYYVTAGESYGDVLSPVLFAI